MTKSWALVASLSLSLILLGLILKRAELLALALPYAAWTLLPLWNDPPRLSLEALRTIYPDIIDERQTARIEIRIANAETPLDEISIRDRLPDGVRADREAEWRCACNVGDKLVLGYGVRARRGTYPFTGIAVEWRDPLGFQQVKQEVPCAGTLKVLPGEEKIRRIAISPRRTRVFSGLNRSRHSGSGVEFYGTRNYVSGDPLRHLNWKAGARWNLLITNLFEQERVADVGVILDARRIMEIRIDGDSLFEHGVGAAASLARHFIERGDRVGLLIYGRFIEWTFPGYGKHQHAKILAALAAGELGEHAAFENLANLPTRIFPPGSQLLLVSPLRPGDVPALSYLRSRGYSITVVCPDAVAFESRRHPADSPAILAERIARTERDTILARLRRNGVRVIDWDLSLPLRTVVEKQARRYRR